MKKKSKIKISVDFLYAMRPDLLRSYFQKRSISELIDLLKKHSERKPRDYPVRRVMLEGLAENPDFKEVKLSDLMFLLGGEKSKLVQQMLIELIIFKVIELTDSIPELALLDNLEVYSRTEVGYKNREAITRKLMEMDGPKNITPDQESIVIDTVAKQTDIQLKELIIYWTIVSSGEPIESVEAISSAIESEKEISSLPWLFKSYKEAYNPDVRIEVVGLLIEYLHKTKSAKVTNKILKVLDLDHEPCWRIRKLIISGLKEDMINWLSFPMRSNIEITV